MSWNRQKLNDQPQLISYKIATQEIFGKGISNQVMTSSEIIAPKDHPVSHRKTTQFRLNKALA